LAAVTLIDLGEPDRFEPGEAPILHGYRRLSSRQRRRAWIAVALAVVAGAVGGVGPQVAPDPQLIEVGRVRGPMTQILDDVVISYSDQDGDIVAYPLDGQGPRWSVPADQPPSEIAAVDDLFVIAFIGLSFLESTINAQRDLPPRILAVQARTGQPHWQVSGWPVGPLTGPVIAVGSGTVEHERVMGVDVTEGKQLWDVPLTGNPLARLSEDGQRLRSDGLLIIEESGAVRTMSLEDGQTRPSGRVVPGASGLFEWRGLLGVRAPSTQAAMDDILVYRLGADEPLWQMRVGRNGPGLSPCGEHLCAYDSAGLRRIDPLTGRVVATIGPDAPDPFELEDHPWHDWIGASGMGNWEPLEMYKGHALVRLDPTYSRDKQAWLGEATLAGRTVSVRPLMSIGPRSNSCSVVPDWLFCDGSAVDDAVSVRLSDLERLLQR
jgi:hypothetical protein